MKKVLALVLALILVFSALTVSATAANGPATHESEGEFIQVSRMSFWFIDSDNGREITVPDNEGWPTRKYDNFFSDGVMTEDIEGLSYDLATNTLTLTDFVHLDYVLQVYAMGEDFKLEIIGDCALARIEGAGMNWGNSITFCGSGTLNVNSQNFFENAVEIFDSDSNVTVNFDKNVEVNLGRRNAVKVAYSSAQSGDVVFTFDGEHNGRIEQTELYDEYDEQVEGYYVDNTPQKEDVDWIFSSVDDPDGLYAGWEYERTEGDQKISGVNVTRYIYAGSLGAYIPDPSFYREENEGENISKFEKQEERLYNDKVVKEFWNTDVYTDGGSYYAYYDGWSNYDQKNVCFVASYAPIAEVDGVYLLTVIAVDDEAQAMIAGMTDTYESIHGVTVTELMPARQFFGYQIVKDGDDALYAGTEGSRYVYAEDDVEHKNPIEIEGYWVDRILDIPGVGLIAEERMDGDYESGFYTPEDFESEGFSFVGGDDHQKRVAVERYGHVRRIFEDVLTDGENSYVSMWDWTEDEGEIQHFLTYAPIKDYVIDGEQQYLFTLTEDEVDPDSLERVHHREKLEGYYDYVLTTEDSDGFSFVGTPVITGHEEPIEFVDIGNTWTMNEISAEYGYMIPLTVEVNPNEPGLTDQMYISDECWTNTEGDTHHSRKNPGPLTPGAKYSYSVTLRAREGYKFVDDFRFVYGGAEMTPEYTISANARTLTVTGLLDTTVFYLPAPTLTKATSGYKGVNLAWDGMEGAYSFRVYVKNGTSWKKLADTRELTYTDTTAKSGTSYTYTVRAMDKGGRFISKYDTKGISVKFYAAPKITKLENTAKGTKLAWSKSAGAAKYRVFIKNGTSWKKLVDTTALSYTNTGVKGGAAYTYTVRAMDKNGKFISAYNTTGWKYTFVATPALPTLKNTKNGIQISFKASKGAAKYRIFRKTGSGGWKKLADTTKLSYVDKSSKRGVTYKYTIRCLDKNGNYVSAYNTTGRALRCVR